MDGRRLRRTAAALSVAALLLSAQAHAQGAGDDRSAPAHPAAQAFDVVVLRPLGLSAVAVGVAFFVPAAILSAPGGLDSLREAWEVFVQVPAEYVYKRPLGRF